MTGVGEAGAVLRSDGTRGGGKRRLAVASLAGVLLVTAGCGQQEDPTTESSAPVATPEPGTPSAPATATSSDGATGTGGTATTSAPADTGPATSTAPQTATATATATVEPTEPDEDFLAPGEVATSEQSGNPDLVVTGVRLGAHEGFDRVVLDLEGTGTIGWRVGYEDSPALDGSGFPVDLAGSETLVVTAVGTRMPEPDEDLYDPGQLLVRGSGLSVVTEVLRVAPFEGQLSAYIGTRERAPFRVFALQDPSRLVIDVAQP
jgi:hypothetical protein